MLYTACNFCALQASFLMPLSCIITRKDAKEHVVYMLYAACKVSNFTCFLRRVRHNRPTSLTLFICRFLLFLLLNSLEYISRCGTAPYSGYLLKFLDTPTQLAETGRPGQCAQNTPSFPRPAHAHGYTAPQVVAAPGKGRANRGQA